MTQLFIIISLVILLVITVIWCINFYEIRPYQDSEIQKEEFEHIDVRICGTESMRSIIEETPFIHY